MQSRIENLLETITVSDRFDKQLNWGPYIESWLDELKKIGLIPVEIGNSYGLRIEAHMGDTMGQSKELYKNPNFTMENVHRLRERGWEFEPDFTVQYVKSHIVHFDTKSHKENDYFQFWQNHNNWHGERDEEELLSNLDEFSELDLIVKDEDKQKDIEKAIVETDRKRKFRICPGILLSYYFDPEKVAKLDNKGELEKSIKKRVREVVESLGKTCDFIDF